MVRLSKEEARALGLAPAASKYNNDKPTYYDPDLKESLKFDSVKEFEYYLVLKDRQKRGDISELTRQVPITILPAFTDISGVDHKPLKYIADFYYVDKDLVAHYIDVKGCKTEIYKLKKKLLAFKGFIIEEV